MSHHRKHQLLAAAAALAIGPSAHAVIIQGSAAGNTTAPTGMLANSGWQWQGNWSAFLGTPIAPQYFITALHTGEHSAFTLNGVNYTTQPFPDTTNYQDFGDLRLWRINGEFPSYAPLYNAAPSADGAETGKSLVVYGRGTERGNPVMVGPTLKGWEWGAETDIKRWGTNTVSSFYTITSGNDGLKFTFDASGGANEGQLSAHDSGGGVFILSGTEYKLVGINHGATGTYRTSPGGSNFNAAIFDSTGLFYSNGTPADGLPGFSVANRISSALATFTPFLNLPPTWKSDASASWTTAGSWTTGTVPNAIDARADFRTVIGTARTVTLNSAQTVGKISFDNVNRYTISGSGSITMDVTAGLATIQVASGNHTILTAITLNDSLSINVIESNSTLTLSNQMTATGMTISKQGSGAAEVKNIRASAANVTAGTLKVIAGGGSAGTSNVADLSVTGTGKLDITNHDVVVPHSGSSPVGSWNGSSYTGLSGAVASGFNNGGWNGPGIVSSIGASNGAFTGVAIGEASEVLGLSGSETTMWSGQTVDATTVLIKYSYVGDLDLNGTLDGDDYFWIDSNALQSGSVFGYHNGDINLDGAIDGDDYFWIDSNIVAAQNAGPILSGAGGGGLAAVPEPVALGILGIPAILLARRNRRRSGA